MVGTVSESIYTSATLVVPLADVQHIERHKSGGLVVVTKHTRWDAESGGWANNIFVPADEATAFLAAWCRYRSELEADTLADISPEADRIRADELRDERHANSQFGVGA